MKEWLRDEGIFQNEVKDTKAIHHLIINYPLSTTNTIDVVFPKDSKDKLVVAEKVTLSEFHQGELRDLDDGERRDFYFDLNMLLANRPTQYQSKFIGDTMTHLGVYSPIYFDALTKHLLMKTCEDVHNTVLLGVWFVQRHLGVEEG